MQHPREIPEREQTAKRPLQPLNPSSSGSKEADVEREEAEFGSEQQRQTNGFDAAREPATNFAWESDEDADIAPDRDYLIDGLFGVGELSVIFGLQKGGKSHFALHLGRCEATGTPAFGRNTPEGGIHVAYIAAEGTSGFTKRVKAHVRERGKAPKFHFLRTALDLATMDGDVDRLIVDLKRFQVGHVYLDTGRRCTPGMKENDPGEMGLFVAVTDRIRMETGAHVTVITHTAKGGTNHTPIGSNALAGASDINIEVTKSADGRHCATVVEARDDEDGWDMNFTLKVVKLGTDTKGREITTCLVDEGDTTEPGRASSAKRPDKLGKTGEDAVDLLQHINDLAADPELRPSRPIIGMVAPVRAIPKSRVTVHLIERGWFEHQHLNQAGASDSSSDSSKGTVRYE
jgi:hypothetical protein